MILTSVVNVRVSWLNCWTDRDAV